MEWYYILLICIGAIILLLFTLSAMVYKIAFGSRCDKNPLLKYFNAEDLNLTAEGFSLGKLVGYIYKNKEAESKNEVIIFVHGLGPGHCAYMTEIAYFCNLGYTVVAVDSLGCGESAGKSIRGMYEGVRTAVKSVDFVKNRFAGSKIYLVGHSWGGYSVLCALAERKVNAAVAISAPVSPVKTLYNGASAQIPKFLAALLCPFLAVCDFFRFGNKSNRNAPKAADKSGIPVLHVYGDNDTIVPLKNSAYAYAKGENVKKLLVKDRGHNPYNSVTAQKKTAELFAMLASARKMGETERNNYFSNFDFKAATEEDEGVMHEIAEFLNNY